MEHTVIHDEKVDRFEVFESGQIAYLQYDEKNGVLDILHNNSSPTVGGAGNSSGFDRGRCEICFGRRA